jgi:hypothetical protein
MPPAIGLAVKRAAAVEDEISGLREGTAVAFAIAEIPDEIRLSAGARQFEYRAAAAYSTPYRRTVKISVCVPDQTRIGQSSATVVYELIQRSESPAALRLGKLVNVTAAIVISAAVPNRSAE